MNLVLTNWKAAVSQWLPAWLREIVVILPLGLLAVALGAPPWVLVFFWTYPFGRMACRRIRASMETAGRPFSFCLPGYRESLRKSSFLVALHEGIGVAPLGLVFSWLPASRDEGPTAVTICLYLINGFLLGAALLLCIGVDLRFIFSRLTCGFVQLLSIPLFFVVVIVSPVFIEYPALGIPATIIVCIFMWVRLGDVSRLKRGHRNILKDAIERPAPVEIGKTRTPRVEEWFRLRVERRDCLSAARYVWADLYVTLGPMLQYWKWILGSLVGIALALGHLIGVMLAPDYMEQWGADVMFIVLGAAAWTLRAPLTSTMLLPGGRRERCYAAVATGVAASLLLVAAALTVVALSWLFAFFLSGTSAEGQRLSYAAIRPGSAFLACLLVPWFLALQLLSYKVRSLERIDWVVFMAVIVLSSVTMPAVQTWTDWTRPILPAGVLVGGWLCFLLLLHLAARHWSIGGRRCRLAYV